MSVTAYDRAQKGFKDLPITRIDRSKKKRVVPMKVLSMGWPRTASMSTSAALSILGFDDVYHMVSFIENPLDAKLWDRALDAKYNGKGTFTREDWDALLGHCGAVTDWPPSIFADELIEAYPEAKVILHVRPSDKWLASMKATIFNPELNWLKDFLTYVDYRWWYWRPAVGRMAMAALGPDPTKAKEKYEEHNRHVQEIVPKDRLLLWGPQDGWEPICKFLDVPIPDRPVPYINESANFAQEWREACYHDLGKFLLKVATIAAIGGAIAYRYKR